MTIEQARIVIEVASCGTLREAANNLYISPSAVSQSIKTLESELGTQIFCRSRTGSSLTAIGTAIFSLCQKIINNANQIDALAHSTLLSSNENSIRMGLCNFNRDIAPILPQIARNFLFSARHCSITDMEYLMDNGFLELSVCTAVRPTFLRHRQKYNCRLIDHTDLLLAMRPENPLTAEPGPNIPLEKLQGKYWALLNPDLDSLLAPRIPDFSVENVRMSSNEYRDILTSVRTSDMLTLLPAELVPEDFVTYALLLGDNRAPRTYNYFLTCFAQQDQASEKYKSIQEIISIFTSALRNKNS